MTSIVNNAVTILILIDGFLQSFTPNATYSKKIVTILILIDGFLQLPLRKIRCFVDNSHNPYFNRWFSAMLIR